MTDAPPPAGIYGRMSLALMNDTTKVDDQERICRDLAGQLGWPVADAYLDNNKSAWQKNRKRPEWDRMLTDIEAGRIGAVIVYHGDRLIRQPYDLERLLALADGKGIRLAAPTGTRDLDSAEDRFILRIEAAMACRESDNTSRRRKTQYQRWRRHGRVRTGGHGGRAFGFGTDGLTHHAAEAAILADVAARILAGQSLTAIARELAARGIRSPAGNVLEPTILKRILTNPRLAGLMPDGEQKAAWEPVLDRADWESLRAALSSNPRYSGSGRGALYLLSGIARCQCGHVMYAGEKGCYRCPRPVHGGCGKVRRSRRLLDAYVISRLVARLDRGDNPAGQIPANPGLAAEYAALTTQRAEIQEALKDHRQGRVTLLMARLDSLDARLAQLRELSGSDARSRLHARYAGITEEEFEDLPLAVQRSLVSAFLDITVLPASKGGPGLRLEDLRVIPR